ncbi:MAG: MraY family glycosyltransferase [Planctomycetota bacterium]
MTAPLLIMSASAFAASFVGTWLAIWIGSRAGAMDGAGVQGQTKARARRVPNVGGVGIVVGLLASVAVGVAAYTGGSHASPIGSGDLFATLVCLLLLHGIGLLDDRRPLPWSPKLAAMLVIPAALAWWTDARLLTAADALAGGAWASIVLTALWFAVVMNAVNFLDNMDGLAGGCTGVIALGTLGVAMVQGQSEVALGAAVLLAGVLGFLPWNYPRARVFMGDGGSLVLGFALAWLTTRLTYVDSTLASDPRWDRLAMPLLLLAVPLYDFVSVILIRLSQGRSPFVGDLQHLSHRFERRGLSKPGAVASIWSLTAVLCLGALIMADATPRQSALVLVQALLALLLLAGIERGLRRREDPE